MSAERAARRLEAALADQARLGDAYSRVMRTPAETVAYLRLRDAGRRVARCERLLRETEERAAGGFSLNSPASSDAPSMVRAATTAWLAGRLAPDETETVRLLVTELVTNAVAHGRRSASAAIETTGGMVANRVRMEVWNRGAGFVHEPEQADPLETGGRGLYLVETLADRWGIDAEAEGCAVWFELSTVARAADPSAAVAAGPAARI